MGSTLPYMPSFAASATHTPQPPAHVDDEEEPEVIREWRERQTLRIAHQDEQSDRKKQETIKKAQTSIDDFYENYNVKKDKLIGETRYFDSNTPRQSPPGETSCSSLTLIQGGSRGIPRQPRKHLIRRHYMGEDRKTS